MLNVQAALVRAHQAYQARRFDEAVGILGPLSVTAPREPSIAHLLALAYRARGDFAGASRAFEQALRLAPRDPEILNNRANCRADLGDANGALNDYAKALEARPEFADARLNRASLLQTLGKHEEALSDLDLVPQNARAHSIRAVSLLALGRMAEAARAYDLALAQDPRRATALVGRARIALQRGEDGAVALLRRAAAVRPNDDGITLQLAEALEASGDPEAIPTLERAVAARPDWAEGQSALARMRWEAGQGRAFTHELERAVRANPGQSALWHAWAGALAAADLHREAADVARAGRAAIGPEPNLLLLEALHASEAGEIARANGAFAQIPPGTHNRAVIEARHRLRTGEIERAELLVGQARQDQPWDVSAWALQGVIWRLRGDERGQWLHGQPGLVNQGALRLDPSELASIADRLRSLHKTRAHPIGQSLRGGTQTRGRLFDRLEPEIRKLRAAIGEALDRHWAALPLRDDAHPLLRHRDKRPIFDGSWSVRLTGGGFHVAHIHPHGVLSSACYLAVPSAGLEGEGWIEIGRPPPELGLDLGPMHSFAPEPGRLVLFPSTLFHGTRPFGTGERLTAAFDVVPAL